MNATSNLDVAREAIDLTSTGIVGILNAHRGLDLSYLSFVNGQKEKQLIMELDNRKKAGWSFISLFVWRDISPHDIEFTVRTFAEYLADPWPQRIFDDFLGHYRDSLGRSGSKTSLVH